MLHSNIQIETSAEAKVEAKAMPLALLVQSLSTLSLDASSLEERIQRVLLENPLLESASVGSDNETRDYLFAQVRQVSSFYDDLHQQLGWLNVPDRMARVAGLLIDCLDEDGYLREDLSQLSKDWHLPVDFLEEALQVVQGLEPAGVGCRSLSECLRLQLLTQEPINELALDIITNHLEALAAKTFPFEDYDPDELSDAMEAIHALSPHPCANCGEDRTQFIIPDIRVFLDEDGLPCAELINQPSLPVLSPLYHEYLKAGSENDRQYVRAQMKDARNFLHALQKRVRTLELIAQFLITQQGEYFTSGPEALRSISLSTLAEALDVHVSTISRAVAGKYFEFNGKVFPLREMFNGNGASNFSRVAIVRRNQMILDAEPSLSDSKIADRLEKQGIHISRRTVNKYRHSTKRKDG